MMKELHGINFSVFSTGHSSLVTRHLPLISLFVTPKLLRHNIGRLPVVDRASPKKVVGYLGRAGILAARATFITWKRQCVSAERRSGRREKERLKREAKSGAPLHESVPPIRASEIYLVRSRGLE